LKASVEPERLNISDRSDDSKCYQYEYRKNRRYETPAPGFQRSTSSSTRLIMIGPLLFTHSLNHATTTRGMSLGRVVRPQTGWQTDFERREPFNYVCATTPGSNSGQRRSRSQYSERNQTGSCAFQQSIHQHLSALESQINSETKYFLHRMNPWGPLWRAKRYGRCSRASRRENAMFSDAK